MPRPDMVEDMIAAIAAAKPLTRDGAVIEANAFIAAGAVIGPGKRVRSGELWAGNPARLMRQLSEKDIEGLRYSADHYVRLKDQYLASAT